MTCTTGDLPIGTKARIKEQFLTKLRGMGIICVFVRGVCWQGWKVSDPEPAQRCKFFFAPPSLTKGGTADCKQAQANYHKEHSKVRFSVHVDTLISRSLTDLA